MGWLSIPEEAGTDAPVEPTSPPPPGIDTPEPDRPAQGETRAPAPPAPLDTAPVTPQEFIPPPPDSLPGDEPVPAPQPPTPSASLNVLEPAPGEMREGFSPPFSQGFDAGYDAAGLEIHGNDRRLYKEILNGIRSANTDTIRKAPIGLIHAYFQAHHGDSAKLDEWRQVASPIPGHRDRMSWPQVIDKYNRLAQENGEPQAHELAQQIYDRMDEINLRDQKTELSPSYAAGAMYRYIADPMTAMELMIPMARVASGGRRVLAYMAQAGVIAGAGEAVHQLSSDYARSQMETAEPDSPFDDIMVVAAAGAGLYGLGNVGAKAAKNIWQTRKGKKAHKKLVRHLRLKYPDEPDEVLEQTALHLEGKATEATRSAFNDLMDRQKIGDEELLRLINMNKAAVAPPGEVGPDLVSAPDAFAEEFNAYQLQRRVMRFVENPELLDDYDFAVDEAVWGTYDNAVSPGSREKLEALIAKHGEVSDDEFMELAEKYMNEVYGDVKSRNPVNEDGRPTTYTWKEHAQFQLRRELQTILDELIPLQKSRADDARMVALERELDQFLANKISRTNEATAGSLSNALSVESLEEMYLARLQMRDVYIAGTDLAGLWTRQEMVGRPDKLREVFQAVQDLVTHGEVDDPVIRMLAEEFIRKRGEAYALRRSVGLPIPADLDRLITAGEGFKLLTGESALPERMNLLSIQDELPVSWSPARIKVGGADAWIEAAARHTDRGRTMQGLANQLELNVRSGGQGRISPQPGDLRESPILARNRDLLERYTEMERWALARIGDETPVDAGGPLVGDGNGVDELLPSVRELHEAMSQHPQYEQMHKDLLRWAYGEIIHEQSEGLAHGLTHAHAGLRFRSLDDALAYSKEFGDDTNLLRLVNNMAQRDAHEIALAQIFGDAQGSTSGGYQEIRKLLTQVLKTAQRQNVRDADEVGLESDSLMRQAAGENVAALKGREGVAAVMAGARNWIMMARLGGIQKYSPVEWGRTGARLGHFTDRNRVAFAGQAILRDLMWLFRSKDDADLAYIEEVLNGASYMVSRTPTNVRFVAPEGKGTATAADKFMRLIGMNRLTRAHQNNTSHMILNELSRFVRKYDSLSPEETARIWGQDRNTRDPIRSFGALLSRIGVTEEDMARLKKLKPTAHNKNLLDIRGLRDSDDPKDVALYLRLHDFITREKMNSINLADVRTREFMTAGRPKGTLTGEGARTFWQFFSVPNQMVHQAYNPIPMATWRRYRDEGKGVFEAGRLMFDAGGTKQGTLNARTVDKFETLAIHGVYIVPMVMGFSAMLRNERPEDLERWLEDEDGRRAFLTSQFGADYRKAMWAGAPGGFIPEKVESLAAFGDDEFSGAAIDGIFMAAAKTALRLLQEEDLTEDQLADELAGLIRQMAPFQNAPVASEAYDLILEEFDHQIQREERREDRMDEEGKVPLY